MALQLNRESFRKLLLEDVAWLELQPRTLERDHIIDILKHEIEHLPFYEWSIKQPYTPA